MKIKKQHALIAGATVAGVSLGLLGGSFALWHDSAAATATQVVSGSLDLRLGDQTYWNVTKYQNPSWGVDLNNKPVIAWARTNGDPVQIPVAANFRFIPGSRVRVVLPVRVVLDGSDMLAKLDVTLEQTLAEHGFSTRALDLVSLSELGETSSWGSVPESGWVASRAKVADATYGEKPLVTRLLVDGYNGGEDSVYDVYAVYEVAFDDVDVNGKTDGDNMAYTLSDILKGTTVFLDQVPIDGSETLPVLQNGTEYTSTHSG